MWPSRPSCTTSRQGQVPLPKPRRTGEEAQRDADDGSQGTGRYVKVIGQFNGDIGTYHFSTNFSGASKVVR